MPQDECSPGSLMGSKCLGTVSYLRKDWISAHPSLFLSLRQVLGRISVLGDGEHWDGSLEALALVLKTQGLAGGSCSELMKLLAPGWAGSSCCPARWEHLPPSCCLNPARGRRAASSSRGKNQGGFSGWSRDSWLHTGLWDSPSHSSWQLRLGNVGHRSPTAVLAGSPGADHQTQYSNVTPK